MPRTRQRTPGVYTQGKNGLNWARNGSLCYAQSMGELAAYGNMLAGRRRRVLFSQCRRAADVTGAAGSRVAFRGYVRPSYQSGVIRAEIICAPVDDITGGASIADTPYVQIHMIHPDLASGGLGTSFRKAYINKRKLGTVTPHDLIRLSQRLTADNIQGGYKYLPVTGSPYMLEVYEANNARIVSICIFEEQASALERQKSTDTEVGATIDIVEGIGGTPDYLLRGTSTWDSSYIGGRLVLTGLPTAGNNAESTIMYVDTTGKRLYYSNTSSFGESFDADSTYTIKDRTVGRAGDIRGGSQIISGQLADHNELMTRIWKDGGGHLAEWSATNAAPKTRTSATYANVFDTSYTAYNAAAPGFWTWPEKMGSYESNNVPCVFWAWIRRAAGASSVGVRFVNSAGTLATLTINSGTAAYVTGTANLDASLTEDKIDVLYAGNATAASCELFAFGFYPYTT